MFVLCMSLASWLWQPALTEAVFLSGGVIVLANSWFALAVRKIDIVSHILVMHMIRFVLYGVGIATIIVLFDQEPLICVITMIVTHIVYVLANILQQYWKRSNVE